MKRLIKIIIILLIFMCFIEVKAASLDTSISKNYVDNIWSFHYRNGKVFSYGQLKFNYANGKLAYCIQLVLISIDTIHMIIGIFQDIQRNLKEKWNYMLIMDMALRIIILLDIIWLLKN